MVVTCETGQGARVTAEGGDRRVSGGLAAWFRRRSGGSSPSPANRGAPVTLTVTLPADASQGSQVIALGSIDQVFAGHDRAVLSVLDGDDLLGTVLLIRGRHGDVFGMLNRCPHRLRGLADGRVRGRVVICPGHGFGFNMCTGVPVGAARNGVLRLRLVRTHVDDGQVSVAIDPDEIRRCQTC